MDRLHQRPQELGLRQDQLPSTHPIAADNHDLEAVEVNFDGITYAKGASVLKQLVAWVGEDEFLAGLRVYFRRHAFGNTEFSDLLSGARGDLGPRPRLVGQGVAADLRRQHAAPGSRSTTRAATRRSRCEQSAHREYPTLRRHRIGIGLYDLEDGPRWCGVRTSRSTSRARRTEVAELVGDGSPTWCCSTTAT